jgi:hypothetical protein
MPVHADVAAFLVGSHPDLADLALWVRELVLDSEPGRRSRVATASTCDPRPPGL